MVLSRLPEVRACFSSGENATDHTQLVWPVSFFQFLARVEVPQSGRVVHAAGEGALAVVGDGNVANVAGMAHKPADLAERSLLDDAHQHNGAETHVSVEVVLCRLAQLFQGRFADLGQLLLGGLADVQLVVAELLDQLRNVLDVRLGAGRRGNGEKQDPGPQKSESEQARGAEKGGYGLRRAGEGVHGACLRDWGIPSQVMMARGGGHGNWNRAAAARQ